MLTHPKVRPEWAISGARVRLCPGIRGPEQRTGHIKEVDERRGGCLVQHRGEHGVLAWMFHEIEPWSYWIEARAFWRGLSGFMRLWFILVAGVALPACVGTVIWHALAGRPAEASLSGFVGLVMLFSSIYNFRKERRRIFAAEERIHARPRADAPQPEPQRDEPAGR